MKRTGCLVTVMVLAASGAAAPPDQTDKPTPVRRPTEKSTELSDVQPLLGKWEVVSIERGGPLPPGELSPIEEFVEVQAGAGVKRPLS